jgi:hypothetical protein
VNGRFPPPDGWMLANESPQGLGAVEGPTPRLVFRPEVKDKYVPPPPPEYDGPEPDNRWTYMG